MKRVWTLLFVLAVNANAVKGQMPFISNNAWCLNLTNPAVTAQSGKIEISSQNTYSYLFFTPSQGFELRENANSKLLISPGYTRQSNYNNLNVTIPIKSGQTKSFGLGFSLINSDLYPLETINSCIVSGSFTHRMGIKGKIHLGINYHRNSTSFTGKRALNHFESAGYYVYINDYKESRDNYDFGVLYSNDSSHFDIGISYTNLKPQNYSVNTIDNKYKLSLQSNPYLIFCYNQKMRISPKMAIKNGAILGIRKTTETLIANLNSTLKYKSFGFGIQFYYLQYSILGPLLQYENSFWGMSYSYGFNAGRLLSAVSGIHNLSLRLSFTVKRK